MSVIIRLQNLPWSANALDIRQYFQGLSIPEGGVHIVGGEQGDAFIAFSTDEDARQAFNRNGGKIKEIQINLNLSSRTEMQRVIESARTQSYAAFMQPTPAPLPAVVPPVVPAAVPELKTEIKKDERDSKDNKRDRRRSRSRDRKDRSRDRDRRDKRRDRSRSRSRERRERRRRERSRSRGRSRSRERDRRSRDTKRADDRNSASFNKDMKVKPEVWQNQNSNENAVAMASRTPGISPFLSNLEAAKNNLNALNLPALQQQGNGFMQNKFNVPGNSRGPWPPVNFQNQNNQGSFGSPQGGPDFRFQDNQMQPGSNRPNDFQNRFQRNNFQRNDNFEQFNSRDEVVKNTCVQLEPFYGGYGEVRRFFQGIFISNTGIKFIHDQYGHRTGIVYIRCGHQQGKIDALNRSGDLLNDMKVTVSHLEDEEFEEAVDRYFPQLDEDSEDSKNGRSKFKSRNITKYFNNQESDMDIKDFSCLIVDDLPTYVKEQDILHMFSLHPLFSLILTTKPRGGHIAYVKFSNAEVAQKALDEKSHHIVGGKAVTVRPCKDEEFEAINKQHEVNLDDKKVVDIGTDCVSISRLPQKTNDRDIADIFSDIGVIPIKIHLMSNHGGFTGQAYCEFESSEDASRAMEKDDTVLGNSNITVKPITKAEMMKILGHTLTTNNKTPVMSHNPEPSRTGPYMGMGMNRPPMMQQFNRPYFNRNNFDGPRGPRFGPRVGPRHRFGPPNMNMNMNMNNGMDDAPPGCTVFMDNVPYKAGTNDILDFFDGYDITNNVSRRYNPNNTPSAEAKVVFRTADEAFRAVQERDGQKIWDRQIRLKQA